MKKIVLLAAFFTAAFIQKSAAQDSTSSLSALLQSYYHIKDALVAGNAGMAASQSGEFVKIANTIDYKLISEGNINALLKDAGAISETKDLQKQRVYFANFSTNMVALAKTVKLTSEPAYEMYCPMKKANWLSNEKQVKNPYYGSAMINCVKVVDTINP
jgi:hypothetical protein